MRTAFWLLALIPLIGVASTRAQTPQPFPRPGTAAPTPPVAAPSPAQPRPAQAPPAQPVAPAPPPTTTPAVPGLPAMPVPIYPTAQFLTSYEAGRGQRYYIFGTTASFADLVAYYRAQLKDRGNQV